MSGGSITNGFVAQDLYNLMQNSGYFPDASAADQYTLMTFANDLTIGPDDTVFVYSVLASQRDGTSEDFEATIRSARTWFINHVKPACSGIVSCCTGRVGDANMSGEAVPDEVTLGDIMLMVDVKFISGDCTKLTCVLEADVNQDGGADATCQDHVTLGDIMILVDFLFITGPENATLPDCL